METPLTPSSVPSPSVLSSRQQQLVTFTNFLRTTTPFSLVKYNDGEWHAMVGTNRTTNCDNHRYCQALKEDLIASYIYLRTSPSVFISDYAVGKCPYPEHTALMNRLSPPLNTFKYYGILHDLPYKGVEPSLTQELHDFYLAIREDKRPKVFVGPNRVDPTSFLLTTHKVSVPLQNAYLKIEELKHACKELATSLPNAVFLLSCGFSSCILAQTILEVAPSSCVIDLGSAIDPILFGKTRKSQMPKQELRDFYKDFNCEWPKMAHYYQEVEGWFNFPDLYNKIVGLSSDSQPGHFLEVGSWLGKSASYMGVEIVNSGKPILFDCVDHFKGSTGERSHKTSRNVKGECANNLRPFWSTTKNQSAYTRKDNLLKIVPKDSATASNDYPNSSLDFIFIDADHTEKGVEADIRRWLPKVKTGGILAGHDYSSPSFPGVKVAVDKLLPKAVRVSKICWAYQVE